MKKLSSWSNNNNKNILYPSNWKVDSWNQKKSSQVGKSVRGILCLLLPDFNGHTLIITNYIENIYLSSNCLGL